MADVAVGPHVPPPLALAPAAIAIAVPRIATHASNRTLVRIDRRRSPAGRRGKNRRRGVCLWWFSVPHTRLCTVPAAAGDGAGFGPAKHEVGCHACPPSKRVPSTARPTIQGDRIRKKAHPRWDRLFRYSDYTRQRNTESGHGSSVAGISFVLGLGACQEFQNVPCPIGAVDVPRAGHFAARPPVLQVVAAHGDASVLPHPSGASAWVRVMCMRPAERRYSSRTRFRSSHAPHSGHTAYREDWAA